MTDLRDARQQIDALNHRPLTLKKARETRSCVYLREAQRDGSTVLALTRAGTEIRIAPEELWLLTDGPALLDELLTRLERHESHGVNM